jgi:trimeric autotransporter adhesin
LWATGEVTAYSASDIRLKKNINNIEKPLDIINKLNPVTYNWNEKAKELNSSKTDDVDAGLIAQEVEEVLPNLVHEMGNGYKSIDYIKVIPYLVGAIKEQQKQIDELNNKLNIK